MKNTDCIFQKNGMLWLFCLIIGCLSLTSCDNILNIDSPRYVSDEDNSLSAPGDSVSSILGVLRQLQDVAESYILLGEMRADLLDVTEYTPAAIRELNDYTLSDTNTYVDPLPYYAIVNNCNYIISRTGDVENPLHKEHALARAIRAWTYMQIAFNWGKAVYVTEPMLSVEDTEKDYPEYDIPQLIDALIADLEPFVDAIYPNYATIYAFTSTQMFFPMRVLLGDLYLWRGASTADYEQAATYYAEYLDAQQTGMTNTPPSIRWTYDNFTTAGFENATPRDSWTQVTYASSGNRELITAIQMATTRSEGKTCTLRDNYQYFGISPTLTDLWDAQTYVLHYQPEGGGSPVDYFTTGDCRKYGNIAGTVRLEDETTISALTKIMMLSHVMLYRQGLIWLRYAEAVNRAGQPQAAFAVLKYGLNPLTFTIFNAPEWQGVPYITVFNAPKYENSEGIHARGCGNSYYDPYYLIGDSTMTTLNDTILNVERLICNELAMETSFEGNRMQDLIRMALRRNDADFLATRIAAKHPADYNRIYNLLRDRKNWFLPEPK